MNGFDPDVIRYEKLMIVYAEDEKGAFLFFPVQMVGMFESIASRPGLGAKKESLGLFQMGEKINELFKRCGIAESYFLCKDDRVSDICARHDFEELTGFRVLRRKTK